MKTLTPRTRDGLLAPRATRCLSTNQRAGVLLTALLAPFIACVAAAAPPSTITEGSRTLTL